MYPPPQTFCLQTATCPLTVSALQVRAVLTQLVVSTLQVKVVGLPSSAKLQADWTGCKQDGLTVMLLQFSQNSGKKKKKNEHT